MPITVAQMTTERQYNSSTATSNVNFFTCVCMYNETRVCGINELVEAGGGAAVVHARSAIREPRSW